MHWSERYIGLPYAANGRTRDGLDCWGLVRLVHAEQFSNVLPSYSDDYDGPEDQRAAELIAAAREGWVRVEDHQPGDVVVLRMWGEATHVGVITEPGMFLHIRIGRDSVVERLDSALWARRIEGVYRYDPASSSVSVGGLVHPLRTIRLDGEVPAGLSLTEIQAWIYARTAAPGEKERSPAIITVDGVTIDPARWGEVRPVSGQRVEYRAVARGDSYRSILQIGVLVGALLLAPVIAPYLLFGGAIGLGTATSLATAALSGAGMILLNYLFPVRPDTGKSLEPGKKADLLLGGSNQPNPYGAIPIVLGQMKYTPPLAASNYVETDGDASYLRAVLCWGYGELQVSDIRIGETPITNLSEVDAVTVSGESASLPSKFSQLYSRDTTQAVPNVELICRGSSNDLNDWTWYMTSWSRVAGGETTLSSNQDDHAFSVGQYVYFPVDGLYYQITSVPNTTSVKFMHTTTTAGGQNPYFAQVWASSINPVTLSGTVSEISVAIHFPAGMYSVKVGGQDDVGDIQEASFRALVQARQLDSVTLAPLTEWGNVTKKSKEFEITLPRARFNTDNDQAEEDVYQWHIFTVNPQSKVKLRSGSYTTGRGSEPSGNLLTRLQQAFTGFTSTFTRLPAIPADEVELWRVCVKGDAVDGTPDDMRASAGFSITGGGLTRSGRNITIAAATLNRAVQESIKLDNKKLKDSFTKTVSFEVAPGRWEVRVIRTTDSNPEPPGNSNRFYYSAFLISITGFTDGKPIVQPKPLAMTAIRVRASNQLNGTVDGFSGICKSVAKDWNGTSWVDRATRNPAALFRHVLQHPANAQAVANSAIDLTALETWHDYCRTNEFMCDMVVVEQQSILDTLRDIAACGRASPALRDGKWTVIVDRPVNTTSQYFTTANSWGFEGSRAYPKLPHAFRVQFNNSERGYQPDEMIVYNDGYTLNNATLFEALTLPGVTTKKAIYKHARFHLAQLKLRPETYTLNVDLEHLICQRGDRVKVTHDVPMWGIASGRIKTRISGTNLILSEPIPMDANTQYGLRIRLEDGSSITRTIASKGTAGLYNDITLTASVTSTEAASGNLFMMGTLSSESVDCLVLAIEPQDNMTARLTLVDYAPSVYDSDTETIPTFDSQITKPPFMSRPTITQKITVTSMVSDESVIELLSGGMYGYRIMVSYTTPKNMDSAIKYVEGQIIDSGSYDTELWRDGGTVKIGQAFYFSNLQQGKAYRMRFRVTATDGRTGPWQEAGPHTVVGRTNKPQNVSGLTLTTGSSTVTLAWSKNYEKDILGYEIRTTDASWGSIGYVARVDATTIDVIPAAAGTARTWYVRAYDSAGLYSAASASVSLTVTAPGQVPVPTQDITKVKNNVVTLALDWAAPTKGTFKIDGYEIRAADSNWGTTGFSYRGSASEAILSGVSASSSTTFYIRAFDTRDNYSSVRSLVHDSTPPPTLASASVTITRNNDQLKLKLTGAPAEPADLDAYEWRIGQVRTGATSGDNNPDAIVSGSTDNFWADPDCLIVRSNVPSVSVDIKDFDKPRYSTSGITYRAACRMRDKSGNYSAASALGSIVVKKI